MNNDLFTLLSAVTTTTLGAAVAITNSAQCTLVVTVASNSGSGVLTTIEGSIDGTNFFTIDASTKTTNLSYGISFSGPLRAIKAKTGAHTAGTVTVKCYTRG